MKHLVFLLTVAIGLSSCRQDRPLRILTCGIRHESNTFSTMKTTEADFRLLRGEEALEGQQWAGVCREKGVELIPTLHAYAWPGGVVEKQAFDRFKAGILEQIARAGKLDGIFLDMHGALHVEGYEDAQATFIEDIRRIVGDKVLISGSFDLHGNLSPAFVKQIDILTGYRTAPHRDGAETKARAVTLLIDALQKGLKPHIETVTIPILVPGENGLERRIVTGDG